MIRKIVKDEFFLKQKSIVATRNDIYIIEDLMDTLRANAEHCVGMAANMIGEKKRIIVVDIGMILLPMINPVIVRKDEPYETEEGCLSLSGVRKTIRYQMIEVEYMDMQFKKQVQVYRGWIAQIIQHEIDHLEGIII